MQASDLDGNSALVTSNSHNYCELYREHKVYDVIVVDFQKYIIILENLDYLCCIRLIRTINRTNRETCS